MLGGPGAPGNQPARAMGPVNSLALPVRNAFMYPTLSPEDVNEYGGVRDQHGRVVDPNMPILTGGGWSNAGELAAGPRVQRNSTPLPSLSADGSPTPIAGSNGAFAVPKVTPAPSEHGGGMVNFNGQWVTADYASKAYGAGTSDAGGYWNRSTPQPTVDWSIDRPAPVPGKPVSVGPGGGVYDPATQKMTPGPAPTTRPVVVPAGGGVYDPNGGGMINGPSKTFPSVTVPAGGGVYDPNRPDSLSNVVTPGPAKDSTLKPVPRAVAQRYITAYGDKDKAMEAMRRDGYDPTQYAD